MKNASATQITTFVGCNRKWFFGWPMGIKPPASAGMLTGRRLHKETELYEIGEIGANSLNPIIKAGLAFIPSPGVAKVELKIKLEDSAVPTIGYIDALDLSGDIARVIDHKFLSNLKYAKTDHQLRDNTQVNIYGVWAAREYDLQTVDVVHLSYRTKGAPKCIESSARLSRPWLEAEWTKHKLTIARMVELYDPSVDPKEIPGVPNAPEHPACRAYGGCPHRTTCQVIEHGKASIFAGLSRAGASKMHTPQPTLEHRALRKAFDQLHSFDQARMLKGATVQKIEDIAPKWIDSALNTCEAWLMCPSPEELVQTIKDAEAAGVTYVASATPDQMHPKMREDQQAWLRAKIAESLSQANGKHIKMRLQHEARLAEEVKAIRADPETASLCGLSEHSGVINPPDATPNHKPVPPKPEDALITIVDGLGDTIAKRIGVVFGLGEVVPTFAQWADSAEPDLFVDVKGLSKVKMDLVEATLMELIEGGTGSETVETTSDSTATQTQTNEAQASEGGASSRVSERGARPSAGSDVDGGHNAGDVPHLAIPASHTCNPAEVACLEPAGAPGDQRSAPLGNVDTDPSSADVDHVGRHGGLTLYIDCRPDSDQTIDVSHIFEPLQREIERDAGVYHWQLVEYGKGPAMLAALVSEAIKNGKVDPRWQVVARSREAGHLPALEVLAQHSEQVVRGVA